MYDLVVTSCFASGPRRRCCYLFLPHSKHSERPPYMNHSDAEVTWSALTSCELTSTRVSLPLRIQHTTTDRPDRLGRGYSHLSTSGQQCFTLDLLDPKNQVRNLRVTMNSGLTSNNYTTTGYYCKSKKHC